VSTRHLGFFVGFPFRMSILTRTGERANHKRLLELWEDGHAKNI
jgi:hypothetical protein